MSALSWFVASRAACASALRRSRTEALSPNTDEALEEPLLYGAVVFGLEGGAVVAAEERRAGRRVGTADGEEAAAVTAVVVEVEVLGVRARGAAPAPDGGPGGVGLTS